jgi:hypothetical protein
LVRFGFNPPNEDAIDIVDDVVVVIVVGGIPNEFVPIIVASPNLQ